MAENILNIVELIENNPLTRLNGDYKSKIIDKIKDKFNDETQQLFVTTFYVYLNYDQHNDFVINLVDVWKWCGFGRVNDAKRLLVKFFDEDVHYKVLLCSSAEQKKGRGGHNKEDILMTVNTFKKFCLKARTKKADEIHDYFLGLEEIVHEIVEEDAKEIVQKLSIKDNETQNTLIENFKDKAVVYVGDIGDGVFKFGYSNSIHDRIKRHKKEITNKFTIKYIYESVYNREIEKGIKENEELKDKIISKEINSKNQTELIQISDELSIEKVNEIIISIKENVEANEKDKNKNIIIDALQLEIKVIKKENEELKEKNEELVKKNSFLEINNNTLENIKNNTFNNASMKDLIRENMNIKRSVVMNFLVDFVAKSILKNNGNSDINITLTNNEIIQHYKQYRLSNKYTEPLHNNQYELNLISKIIKKIPGILYYRKRGGEGVRVIHLQTLGKWIATKYIIPKQFRNTFTNLVIKKDYYQHKTQDKDLKDENKHIHDFLVVLLIKNIYTRCKTSKNNDIYRPYEHTNNIKNIRIKNTVVRDEYLKFYINDSYKKKLKINRIYKEFEKIPGLVPNFRVIINEGTEHNSFSVLEIDVDTVIGWIKNNLKLDKRTYKLLYDVGN